jgi:hypothetical protein
MSAEGNVDLIVHEAFFRHQKRGVLVEVGQPTLIFYRSARVIALAAGILSR